MPSQRVRVGGMGVMAAAVLLQTSSLSLAWADTIDGRPSAHAVAVIRAPGPDRVGQEIVTRIVAELMADGVPVVALTCGLDDAVCASLPGMRLTAIVSIRQREDTWVIEVRTAKTSVSFSPGGRGLVPASTGGRINRVGDSDAGAAPAALAIRTVELLKAMSIDGGEVEVESPPPAAVVPETDSVPTTTKTLDDPRGRQSAIPPVGPHNLIMGVGAMMFAGFSTLESAYGPTLSLGRRTSDHVMLSLVLAGPSFGPDQRNNAGTASVRHEMGALQVDLQGLFWDRVVLRAGIGGGVYHVQVDGKVIADIPNVGGATTVVNGSSGGFAWLLSWSAAAVMNLRPDVGIFLQGRMFVLTPTPVILLNGLEMGRAGNPGLALSSGLELRF